MSGKEKLTSEEAIKGSVVINAPLIFMSPFFHRLGPSASFILIAAGLAGLHELGRQKRAESYSIFSIFSANKSSAESTDVATISSNVLSGGASVFDKLLQACNRK